MVVEYSLRVLKEQKINYKINYLKLLMESMINIQKKTLKS